MRASPVRQRRSVAKFTLCLLVLLYLLVPACRGGTETSSGPGNSPRGDYAGALTVFAAASLTDAFTEMGAEFQRANTRARVTFNFASSTALRTQLEQGANADIFASADQAQMDAAIRADVITGPDMTFAKNRLVVIVPASNPASISTPRDLGRPGVRFVLTDANVPIGAYARTALGRMSRDPQYGPDFADRVQRNLRSEEANVRAVVTKVQLGEADAGIAYTSDVSPSAAKGIVGIEIPDAFNVVATYPIAVTRDARNREAARGFVDFVRSPAGRDILRRHNFIVDF